MSTSTPSSSPSPPPSQPPPPQQPTANPTPISTRKPQAIPWTHQETVFLIQAYQEKWYSLKRGQLKANQWDQISAAVAARCGYEYSHPSKTPIQCRHKMEKLRRRYRDEKRHLSFSGGYSNWPYFTLMDSLESGPLPISARPFNQNSNNDDEDEDEEDDDDDSKYSKSRSINCILQRPMMVNRFSGSEVEGVKRRRTEGGDEAVGVAEEIRGFAERMMWIERQRMEMVRETERWRMQMEKKRMEMILNSHKKITDMIANAFDFSKDEELEPH